MESLRFESYGEDGVGLGSDGLRVWSPLPQPLCVGLRGIPNLCVFGDFKVYERVGVWRETSRRPRGRRSRFSRLPVVNSEAQGC